MPDLADYTKVANDGDIQARVAACVATKGEADPVSWATANRWKVATFGTIAESYQYAEVNKTINVNPRTGQRTDTVLDSVLEDAVDAILAEQPAP